VSLRLLLADSIELVERRFPVLASEAALGFNCYPLPFSIQESWMPKSLLDPKWFGYLDWTRRSLMSVRITCINKAGGNHEDPTSLLVGLAGSKTELERRERPQGLTCTSGSKMAVEPMFKIVSELPISLQRPHASAIHSFRLKLMEDQRTICCI